MRLERSDEIVKLLDEHMLKFDENIIRLDEHMNKLDSYLDRLNEQMVRYSEHINRLDDLVWKSYSAMVTLQGRPPTQEVETNAHSMK